MGINYPVDVKATRGQWARYNTQTAELITGQSWPQARGLAIPGLDADVVYLLKVVTAHPQHDPSYQQIVSSQVIDEASNELRTEWAVQSLPVETVAENKRNEIRAARDVADNAPVDVDGVLWQASYEDVTKLDGARRMSMEAGLSEVTLWDANNAAHALTTAEATVLVLTLGARLQANIATKQARFSQIAQIEASALTDEEKIAALVAVTW